MNNLKKTINIQAILIVLQVFSMIALFMCIPWFYTNWNVLKKSDFYSPNSFVIESFDNSSANETPTNGAFANGKINNTKKHCLINTDRTKEGIGDTLLVWSITGKASTILRLPHETKFNKWKYEKINLLIIFFVFIPTIIIWISERILTKRIKKLKRKMMR